MKHRIGTWIAPALLALSLLAAGSVQAAGSIQAAGSVRAAGSIEDRCAAAKEKAAGRLGQSGLACHALAAKAGVAVDPACLSRAAAKMSSAFAKAETSGGCATSGDATAVSASVLADVDDAVALLPYVADAASQACSAAKRKVAGKHYATRLGCFARGAALGVGADPSCTSRARDKLLSAFAKAEARGGCTTTSDATDLANQGSSGADARVAQVSALCGDGITGVGNACDGSSDAACPDLCTASCTCANLSGCGNGVAEYPEECDDGDVTGGDGCSAACQLEDASALCTGVPSSPGTAIDAVLVSSGFSGPIHAAAPPLDATRLFVVEREGRIRVLRLADNSIVATPFLDITSLVGTSGEGGLLSMAFAPDYDSSRRFFVNYTNNAGDTVIARYETSATNRELADVSSARILLTIDQPYSNHNGGQVAFGPDGYLYVGMGDGGGDGDPLEASQDDAELLGKMLRVDVGVATAPYWAVPATNPHWAGGASELELVWAKGLRNPWRFSFDRGTGDLVIGDVGQNEVEEIDLQSAPSTGGENYGWDVFEGTTCYEPDPAPVCPAPPTGFTMPILEYPHDSGPCWAVTGGFVYRGCALPDLRGTYFYSDSCLNFLKSFEISGGTAVNAQDRTADATELSGSLGTVVSFAEDARGEVYVIDISGSIYRLQAD